MNFQFVCYPCPEEVECNAGYKSYQGIDGIVGADINRSEADADAERYDEQDQFLAPRANGKEQTHDGDADM